MTSFRRVSKRGLAVVAAATLGLSALAGAYFAVPALADTSAVAAAARQAPLVPGTPCTVTAKSCVDLEISKAWLIEDGKIIRGPVTISSGGNGKETPIGHSLRVYRKEKDHKSLESRLPNGQPAPMPWSVFFEDGGIAFHGGDPRRSSGGCIHLGIADAQAWFNYLQVGDQVQVVNGSEERAARAGGDDSTRAAGDHGGGPDDNSGDNSGDNNDNNNDSDNGDRHRHRHNDDN